MEQNTVKRSRLFNKLKEDSKSNVYIDRTKRFVNWHKLTSFKLYLCYSSFVQIVERDRSK